nr:hypothetical protein CFP56_77948 [Quercus suber]
MVYFRDISSSDKKYLVISKDQNDATEKGLSLLVEKPIIGRFSPVWPKQNNFGDIVEWTYDTSQNPDSPSRAWSLRTSLHKNTTESGPLRTLGRRIISGETRWGTVFRINGGARYYDEYEARRLIQGNRMLWGANLLFKNANETFEDSGNLSRTSLAHFISIRSFYLSMRQNDHFIIEPYSPCRFSRQFGLCQSIVGGIKKDIRHASLDEVLELWRSCTKSKTMAQAFFPAPPSNLKHHTTQSYGRWWNSMHGTYLEDGIASLISSTRPPLPRTKTGQINREMNDNGGGIQLSDDHITRVVPESVTDKAQFVKPQDVMVKPKMSPFKAFLVEGPSGVCMASNEKMDSYLEKVSESSDKECHWRRAKKKLKLIAPSEPDLVEGTSYAFEHIEVATDQLGQQVINTVNSDKVTSIDSETSISGPRPIAVSVGNIFDAIAANKAMDPSPLQSLVADYFEKAKSFELLQSSFSTSVMSEQRDKQLADCNFRLAEQSTIKNELIACGETLSDGLMSVEARTVELQEELEHLSNRKKDFKASILNNDEKLSNQSSIISSIQDEISFIENAPSLSNADIESLQLLEQGLETARDELENYNWKY